MKSGVWVPQVTRGTVAALARQEPNGADTATRCILGVADLQLIHRRRTVHGPALVLRCFSYGARSFRVSHATSGSTRAPSTCAANPGARSVFSDGLPFSRLATQPVWHRGYRYEPPRAIPPRYSVRRRVRNPSDGAQH